MKFMASLATLLVVGLLIICFVIPFDRVPHSDERTVDDPRGEFSDIVGFVLPKSATEIVASDDHGGFHGDGTFRLTARVPIPDVEQMLSTPAPWNTQWVTYSQLPQQAKRQVSESHHARFAARERCCDSLEWHNGDILAVDPKDGSLALVSWDY